MTWTSDGDGPDAGADTPIRLSDKTIREGYRALQLMARVSSRSQAEVSVALRRANLDLDGPDEAELLARLKARDLIENVIMLQDGGTLVTVISLR